MHTGLAETSVRPEASLAFPGLLKKYAPIIVPTGKLNNGYVPERALSFDNKILYYYEIIVQN
jgi:hypothetical protein